jgi:hypothetical protein
MAVRRPGRSQSDTTLLHMTAGQQTSQASEAHLRQQYSSVSGSSNDSATIAELRRQVTELQTSLSDVRQRDSSYQDIPTNPFGNHGYEQPPRRGDNQSYGNSEAPRHDVGYGGTSYQSRSHMGEPNFNQWGSQATPAPPQGSFSRHQGRGRNEEPKPRLPIFNGKTEWEPFWVQFEQMSTRYGWGVYEQGEQLLFCLKDEALAFASHLTSEERTNAALFVQAMKRRFGDHVMAETHRMNLQILKKLGRESMQEYASRVSSAMTKAYPGLDHTSQLFTELTIEHLLNGLQDQSLAYDVMTKRPPTLESALEMLTWHECCKGGISRKKTVVRQVTTDYNPEVADYDDEVDVRRVNGQRFVTEGRLEQFGRDLKESLLNDVTSKFQTSMAEMSETITKKIESSSRNQTSTYPPKSGEYRNNYRKPDRNQQGAPRRVECFACNEVGHYIRDCPTRKPRENRPNPAMDVPRESSNAEKNSEN